MTNEEYKVRKLLTNIAEYYREIYNLALDTENLSQDPEQDNLEVNLPKVQNNLATMGALKRRIEEGSAEISALLLNI